MAIQSVPRLRQEIAKAEQRTVNAKNELAERQREAGLYRTQLPLLNKALGEVDRQQQAGTFADPTIGEVIYTVVYDQYVQCQESLAQAEADIKDLNDELELAKGDRNRYQLLLAETKEGLSA